MFLMSFGNFHGLPFLLPAIRPSLNRGEACFELGESRIEYLDRELDLQVSRRRPIGGSVSRTLVLLLEPSSDD